METITIEKIMEKLKTVEYKSSSYWDKMDAWDGWSDDERLALLKIYSLICEKEANIYDLVYHNQGVDSWEDIFRDYSVYALEDKAIGVQVAIDEMTGIMGSDEDEGSVEGEGSGSDGEVFEDLVAKLGEGEDKGDNSDE